MQKEDKLIIGGHEFHSRFILGSGKYSLKLIEAAVKDAGAEVSHWLCAARIQRIRKTFWISFLKMLPCCPIPPAQEMPRRQSVLQDWQENWAVVIS